MAKRKVKQQESGFSPGPIWAQLDLTLTCMCRPSPNPCTVLFNASSSLPDFCLLAGGTGDPSAVAASGLRLLLEGRAALDPFVTTGALESAYGYQCLLPPDTHWRDVAVGNSSMSWTSLAFLQEE